MREDSEVLIKRHGVSNNFTTLPNAVLRDKLLSWKATGLLAFLLSLPPDFKLYLSHLSNQKKDGRDSTRSGLRELENAGYLRIEQSRKSRGRFDQTVWHVSDIPEFIKPPSTGSGSNFQPHSENPKTVNSNTEKPTLEKPTLISTDLQNTNKQKTTTTEQDRGRELIFPALHPIQRQQIEQVLTNIDPVDGQIILDELAARLISDDPKLKVGVPLKWIKSLIKNGVNITPGGLAVARGREKAALVTQSNYQNSKFEMDTDAFINGQRILNKIRGDNARA